MANPILRSGIKLESLLKALVTACAFLLLLGNAAAKPSNCTFKPHPAPQKPVYRIGVLAIRGVEKAKEQFQLTFSDYLTESAGSKFEPPISFEMVPVPFGMEREPVDEFIHGDYDFVFANPSMFSCIDSEVGLNTLVSLVSRRKANGQEYPLTQFGGVIFTWAGNDDIDSVLDLKEKRLGLVSVSGLGSGQMQFREMMKAGLHHLQDPKQLIFLQNQNNVVNAVLNKEIDVGFVRTDQLERFVDPATGELLDLSRVKVIGKREELFTSDGTQFPFPSSTPLYPEWALASLPTVGEVVEREVQTSLIDLSRHSSAAPALLECYDQKKCATVLNQTICLNSCDPEAFETCDATQNTTLFAHQAKKSGKYTGWRTSLSYMALRNMQEEIGFIQNRGGSFQCTRGKELADSVVCPEGHFKKGTENIQNGCEDMGLPCYGFQCICKPCVKAFDVDFYPVSSFDGENQTIVQAGCSKFEVCGAVQQNHKIVFRAVDNRKRHNASFVARVRVGKDIEAYPLDRVFTKDQKNTNEEEEFTHAFEFDASTRRTGFLIVEVYADGEQIPESPFRLEVTPRDCVVDTGDSLREPDATGKCVCMNSAVQLGSSCTPLGVLIPSILIPILLVVAVVVFCYVAHKRRQADLIWKVEPEEISFSQPPQVLGKGRFGLVLLAEYRGTQVAVKRVLTPGESSGGIGSSRVVNVMKTKEGGQFFPLPKAKKGHPESHPEDKPHESGSIFDIRRVAVYDGSETETDVEMGLKSGFYLGPTKGKSGEHTFMSSGTRNSRSRMVNTAYSKLKADFVREMRLLSQLRHPCITTVMGAVMTPNNDSMLVMEYMELGSLRDVLRSPTMVVDDNKVLGMVQDVAKGIRFLHAANPNVIHGDLKAQNVLVDSNFRAKVSDFGLSRRSKYQVTASGTPFWMAPELVRGETGNTTMSDIYSFGILLYEAYARAYPYEGEDAQEVLRLVADPKVNKRPPIPARSPQEVADIMEACLLGQPEGRPTADEIDAKLAGVSRTGTKTQALLWQLFPRHVAAALRDGRKVEPETHENVTVYFSDIVGYTSLGSALPPTKLSNLLDRLYTKFDSLCDLHNVFKVETVGDAFMCVTNLAEEQHDHVRIMAAFATDALKAAACTLIDDKDPSRGYVRIRVGFHTGPVVSHVVGSKTPRYSIIGDTVNTAARMESMSVPGRVQCSDVSAALLKRQDPEAELFLRGKIDVKGKGDMVTYWVGEPVLPDGEPILPTIKHGGSNHDPSNDMDSLIEWNVDVLHRIIRQIAAARDTLSTSSHDEGKSPDFSHLQSSVFGQTVFDEVKEVVPLPPFDAGTVHRMKERQAVSLPTNVLSQLRDFVTTIAFMYHDVPFHNFQHASHVTLSVVRLLTRIKAVPNELDGEVNTEKANLTLHQCSYGIASDPITQLAIVFSALIHDVDHQGVPNAQLVKEDFDIATIYKGRSVAEQNSVDLAWALFMDPKYSDLRATIAQTEDEMSRFRQLVINCVLATDIVDKELKNLRNQRWERAFAAENSSSDQDSVNRKATIVIEYILQASDIAHTMQQWHVYRKWNERFFRECYMAFKAGRAENDPSKGWYKGEIGFFDFYIIPLAKKLQESGVFGAYGDEYVKNAQANRDEWERRGKDVVAEMMSKVHGKNRTVTFSTASR